MGFSGSIFSALYSPTPESEVAQAQCVAIVKAESQCTKKEVTNLSTQPRPWEYLEPIYQWLSCVGLLGCMPLVECPRLFSLVDSGAICTTGPWNCAGKPTLNSLQIIQTIPIHVPPSITSASLFFTFGLPLFHSFIHFTLIQSLVLANQPLSLVASTDYHAPSDRSFHFTSFPNTAIQVFENFNLSKAIQAQVGSA